MTTTTTRPSTPALSGLTIRKAVLYVNGTFLALMGGAFAVFDLLSYWFGAGPLGALYYNDHVTVGLFEAHGFALIMGLLLLRAARLDPRAVWHLTGAGIHLLLGCSNLIFWALFLIWNVVTAEVVITTIHWLFVIAHLLCLRIALSPANRKPL